MTFLRSRLPLVSAVAMLLGLELATGALSYAVLEFRRGWDAFLNPNIDPDPVGMIGGTALLVAGASGLALWLWVSVSMRGISGSDRCPACGMETRRIRRTSRHKVLSALSGESVSRRKCKHCGWKGLSYRS